MPPSMSTNNDDIGQQLTNEEIKTLYDIVELAQTLPGPRYRALFAAYDRIRAKGNRIQDGSRCFTFLLRMQDERAREDTSLVDTFQRVLLDMGIQVEVDPTGEGVEITDSQLEVNNGADTQEVHLDPRTSGRILSRRSSFDSFFDGSADKVAGTEREHRLPYRTRADASSSTGVAVKKKRRSMSNTETRTGAFTYEQRHAEMNGTSSRRSVSDQVPIRGRRNASVSSRGSLRIRRAGEDEIDTHEFSDYDGDDSQHTDSFDRSHVQIPGVNAPIPGDFHQLSSDPQPILYGPIYRPSETQIWRDAQVFDSHRVSALANRFLQNWRDRLRDHHKQIDDMHAAAIAFDRNVLLKASVESWKIAYQNKRAALETNLFFDRLESRAAKARNLFLLTKAFTHWAKSAEDEVQRTSVARRHIIRTKYFNAWRDITAVNELKIQHFVLGNFIRRWRTRAVNVNSQNDLAVDLYLENLKNRTYWKWFHAFANRNAPLYHAKRLAKQYFHRWLEITRVTKERNAFEGYRRDRNVLRDILDRLIQKTAALRSMELQADEFRRTALISSAFYTLSKQSQLRPIERAVYRSSQDRIVDTLLQLWRRDTRLSLQAKFVDRERILRNALTVWNDALRTKEMKRTIDDRVLIGCLYKWSLATRVSSTRRTHEFDNAKGILNYWLARTRDRETRLASAERKFAQHRRANLMKSALAKLENATLDRRNQQSLAVRIHDSKLNQTYLPVVTSRLDVLRQMNDWADRARYYITTKHALQQWHKATEGARRARRREAYTQFRRKSKLNLVRRTFNLWRNKLDRFTTEQQKATEILDDRILGITSQLLIQWKERSTMVCDARRVAEQKDELGLLRAHMSKLLRTHWTLRDMDNQAVALKQESTELIAVSSIKKLGWRLWNVQRQRDMAIQLHRRNFEKNTRAMIRFWLEQTRELIATRRHSPSPSARTTSRHEGEGVVPEQPQSYDWDDEAGDETRRLEGWTAFDENSLGVANLDLPSMGSPSQQTPASFMLDLSQRPAVLSQSRPATYPHPQSSMRPPTIAEVDDLDDEAEGEFWSSTPMPPSTKPGYLKTPSKRSVARAKHPELPSSPGKRQVLPAIVERMGTASAPPVPGLSTRDISFGGVTSFERRLREGGFGRTFAAPHGQRSSIRGQGRGDRRVGFGDTPAR
ncbi:Sfi1-domain-containing protein [Aaosphaeria arxii CBS 175.79]|uniref:Sfi1-domain-containing protein n=1 Tax=Aaosphaeria arxii CBS 175.79 TaxID=1450172 RepID=A0A6A5Y582_9PLEO|nr:Sfi1-domain-containing protein [Aaosphaeria arxii CBS 175.79]KAF2020436.1 Sfi1-domain-containing protein [Aaosphaeria arxii CBS 175.79]